MNYCHKCQSHYEKPGTCNCFAEKPPEQPAPVYVPYPYYPVYPIYPAPWPAYPYEPFRITWWSGDTMSISGGSETTVYSETKDGTPTYVSALPVDPNAPVSIYGTASA